ncbi:hypothetical protein BD309DRAFT_869914 [Dichomitus squalens]|nr:hypothetical protein BD311DRAFT_664978 [Dichomitus squalens]TBU40612.1 hypothetical protein BD309DRAFT_869914 [Dichomitus squalens]
MVVYDWMLSLPREARLFITGTARPLSAWLYFTNRYSSLLNLIFGAAMHYVICIPSVLTSDILVYLSIVPQAVFNGLRAFALSQSWTLSLIILALSFMPIATGMVKFRYHFTGTYSPFFHQYGSLHQAVILVNRTSTIIADILLVILTWRSLSARTSLRASGIMTEKGLTGVMLRNGMLYFVVLLILNILLLILFENLNTDTISGSLTPYVSYLSSILISHFMLDLQDIYQRNSGDLLLEDALHTSLSIRPSTLSFVRAMGSLATHIDSPDLDLLEPEWHDLAETNQAVLSTDTQIMSDSSAHPEEGTARRPAGWT